MSDDLVKRLRSSGPMWQQGDDAVSLRKEAADEIQRLRIENAAVTEIAAARHAAEAEVARLREALQPFADFAVDKAPADHVITQGSSMAQRQLTMGDCQRARQALAQQEQDNG